MVDYRRAAFTLRSYVDGKLGLPHGARSGANLERLRYRQAAISAQKNSTRNGERLFRRRDSWAIPSSITSSRGKCSLCRGKPSGSAAGVALLDQIASPVILITLHRRGIGFKLRTSVPNWSRAW